MTTYVAVENAGQFAVYRDGDEFPIAFIKHDDDFPPFNDGGYEASDGIEAQDDDSVELSYEGCPEGYVIVIIKRRGSSPSYLLYGPEGLVGEFPSKALAQAAADADATLRNSGRFGPG